MTTCVSRTSVGNGNYKIKILFVSVAIEDFIKRDIELLRKYFNIKVIKWEGLKPIILLKMIKGILWADLTFSWFGAGHAFYAVLLSRMLRKKSIVVIGGYEVAKVQEIDYGLLLNPKSASRVKYVLENADKILAVSKFNKKEILKYRENLKNIKLVYNGIDVCKFKPKGKKEDIVITVGIINKLNLKRKGLETFVRAAIYLRDIKFVLIGKHVDDSIDYLKSIAPLNVEFTGFVSDEELLNWYQRAKVYCQLSIYESFGVALAEAMACECVPVVTNKGALPEVVGNTGFYVPYSDPKATAEAIKKALKSDKGEKARKRIKKMFPLERREKKLVGVIGELI